MGVGERHCALEDDSVVTWIFGSEIYAYMKEEEEHYAMQNGRHCAGTRIC